MKRGLRDRLQDAKSSIRKRVGSDVRHADRRATDAARSARERVKSIDREDARRAVRKAGKSFEGVDAAAEGNGLSPTSGDSNDTFAAAEDASTMAPPVDASLSPTTSPEDVDEMVTGGGDGKERETGSLGFEIDEFGGRDDDGPTVDDMARFGGSGDDDRDRDDVDDLVGFGFGGDDDDGEGWF